MCNKKWGNIREVIKDNISAKYSQPEKQIFSRCKRIIFTRNLFLTANKIPKKHGVRLIDGHVNGKDFKSISPQVYTCITYHCKICHPQCIQ